MALTGFPLWHHFQNVHRIYKCFFPVWKLECQIPYPEISEATVGLNDEQHCNSPCHRRINFQAFSNTVNKLVFGNFPTRKLRNRINCHINRCVGAGLYAGIIKVMIALAESKAESKNKSTN